MYLGAYSNSSNSGYYTVIIQDYDHFNFTRGNDKFSNQKYNPEINPVENMFSTRILKKKVISNNKNRILMLGLIDALNTYKTSKRILLYTDMTYITEPFNKNWIVDWKIRGWKTQNLKPVTNADLWKQLYEMNLSRHISYVYANKKENKYLGKAYLLAKDN